MIRSILLLSGFCFFVSQSTAQTIEYVYPENAVTYEKEIVGDSTSLNFFQGSLEGAIEKAKEERKLVFLDFYADWCAPCKLIEQEVFPRAKFKKYIHNNYIVYKVHGDNFENGGFEYAQKMNVNEWPTLMVLNTEGEELGRISGYKTMDTYLLALRKIERYGAYRR